MEAAMDKEYDEFDQDDFEAELLGNQFRKAMRVAKKGAADTGDEVEHKIDDDNFAEEPVYPGD
jgi:hypothetical protein